MTIETIKNSIEEKLKLAPALGAKYKFDFGDGYNGIVKTLSNLFFHHIMYINMSFK